jgi:hypothetical protein
VLTIGAPAATGAVLKHYLNKQVFPQIEQGYQQAGISYDRNALPKDLGALLGLLPVAQGMQNPQPLPRVRTNPEFQASTAFGPPGMNWRDYMQQIPAASLLGSGNLWAQRFGLPTGIDPRPVGLLGGAA